MNCKICSHSAELLFTRLVLKKYTVKYFQCGNCKFIFTEEPYWLEEAYKSPINYSDTGLLQRNIIFTRKASVLLYYYFNKNAKYLDYAGGYGIFTRLMRDAGFDFYWYDPYCQNLFAKNFEADISTNQKYELLTSFESFEHFSHPLQEIKKMLCYSDNILFSTELIPNTLSKLEDWWYLGFDHGQHVSFYSYRALEIIANNFNLNVLIFGKLFLFTNRIIGKRTSAFVSKIISLLSPFVKYKSNSLIEKDFEYIKSKGKQYDKD